MENFTVRLGEIELVVIEGILQVPVFGGEIIICQSKVIIFL